MKGRTQGRWSLLAMLTTLQALGFANRFLLALLATPVERSLGMDDFHMGLLQGTAFVVPFVAFTPVFGLWVDRSGGGPPLLSGLALTILALGGSAMAHDFNTLLAARALLGAGEAAIAPVALVEIARGAAASGGLGTALFAAGGPLGKGLALTGGGALLAAFAQRAVAPEPWRAVMWVAAALNLLAFGAAGWRARDRRRLAKPASSGAGSEDAREAVRWRSAWLLAAAGVLAVLASQTLALWAPSLFARSFGLSPARAGGATGTPLLILVPALGLVVGWSLDRAGSRGGRRSPMAIGLAVTLAAAAAAALALRAAGGLGAAQLAFSALACLLAAASICALRGVQLQAPAGARGRVVAAYVAVANLVGFGVGPPLVGRLAASVGLADALAAVLAGACLLGAAAVLPLLVKPLATASSSSWGR